jgi:hypothetical protein
MTRNILLCVGLLALAAGMALTSSNNVKNQEDQLAQLNRDIASEQDRIRVLTAEWHTLKTPGRLETLTQRHLTDLHPANPKQVATLASLLDPLPAAAAPAPVAEVIAPAEEKPVEVAAAVPPTLTPAVAPPEPAAAPKPAAPVRAATTPSRPLQRAATRATPARQQAAPKTPDSIEAIIAQTENPFHEAVSAERRPPRRVNDELSELIERQPAEGVLWASAGGRE